MRTLEKESLAREKLREIMRKIKDIKNGVSEIEEQLGVMERCRKTWKAAEEESNAQTSTATTEVKTIEQRVENEISTQTLSCWKKSGPLYNKQLRLVN